MDDFTILFDGETTPKARLALLLEHFSELSDDREPDRIMYRLDEVLLLVTCATISSCDDFDEIVAWGQHHLGFLRRFSEFYFGVPANAGCEPSSTVSIPSCLAAASKAGSQRFGPIDTTSSPSTARRRGAPTIAARASRRCIRSAPTPPTPA
jgi:hypothetical protein